MLPSALRPGVSLVSSVTVTALFWLVDPESGWALGPTRTVTWSRAVSVWPFAS